jgi:hypothetical protein
MIKNYSILYVALVILLSACNQNASEQKETKSAIPSFTTIEIHLYPAFNNPSIIHIDKTSRTVRYTVDTAMEWTKEKPGIFSCSLDSFEINTSVESFYSQSFLDSIKETPGYVAFDGLSIYTVVKHDKISDTIRSGNVFPDILNENILSQINYISKNTSDSSLIKYIKNLRGYF